MEWRRESHMVKPFGKYALVIIGSLLTGVFLFVGSFVAMDFVWTRFVVHNRKNIGLGDGVMVVGCGFLVGCSAGVAGLVAVLYRFWPRRTQNQPLPK